MLLILLRNTKLLVFSLGALLLFSSCATAAFDDIKGYEVEDDMGEPPAEQAGTIDTSKSETAGQKKEDRNGLWSLFWNSDGSADESKNKSADEKKETAEPAKPIYNKEILAKESGRIKVVLPAVTDDHTLYTISFGANGDIKSKNDFDDYIGKLDKIVLENRRTVTMVKHRGVIVSLLVEESRSAGGADDNKGINAGRLDGFKQYLSYLSKREGEFVNGKVKNCILKNILVARYRLKKIGGSTEKEMDKKINKKKFKNYCLARYKKRNVIAFHFVIKSDEKNEFKFDDLTAALKRIERSSAVNERMEKSGGYDNLLLTIGVGRGGEYLYRAISETLKNRFLLAGDGSDAVLNDSRGFGDLVVIADSEMLSSLFAPLHKIAFAKKSFSDCQSVRLAFVSSRGDSNAFTATRWIDSFFGKYEEDQVRRGYVSVPGKKENVARSFVLDQRDADIFTIGHFDPFTTDLAQMVSDEASGSAAKSTDYGCVPISGKESSVVYRQSSEYRPDWNGQYICLSRYNLKQMGNAQFNNPYLVISAEDGMIANEGRLWPDPAVTSGFMPALIDDLLAKKKQMCGEK